MKSARRSAWLRPALLTLALLAWLPARGADVSVAVATNFAETLETLAQGFEAETGHQLLVSSGSTGQLYAQIRNGAPFDVFLAADSRRPALLEEQGLGVDGSRFTYASGRLALWSSAKGVDLSQGLAVLKREDLRSLAIANPRLAPYGLAAQQVLKRLGLWEELRDSLVLGENIGQTYAVTATANAELGFVAMAQLLSPRAGKPGEWFEIPARLHEPIAQDAMLLRRGAGEAAARAFLEYLRSPRARALIAAHGYGVD